MVFQYLYKIFYVALITLCLALTGCHKSVLKSQFVAINILPLDAQTTVDTPIPFLAWGVSSDGAAQDITSQVTWSSSSENIATISNAKGSAGVALAKASGATIITASLDGISASTSLTVTLSLVDATIQILCINCLPPSQNCVKTGPANIVAYNSSVTPSNVSCSASIPAPPVLNAWLVSGVVSQTYDWVLNCDSKSSSGNSILVSATTSDTEFGITYTYGNSNPVTTYVGISSTCQ